MSHYVTDRIIVFDRVTKSPWLQWFESHMASERAAVRADRIAGRVKAKPRDTRIRGYRYRKPKGAQGAPCATCDQKMLITSKHDTCWDCRSKAKKAFWIDCACGRRMHHDSAYVNCFHCRKHGGASKELRAI